MQVFRKITTICLALLLMVSTSGLTINKHYCLGFLKDISILHEASSCMAEMNLQEEECPMECCEETSESVMVDDFKQAGFNTNLAPDLKLIAVISHFLADAQLISSEISHNHFQYYSPPLIDRDIPIMVQSFLL
ncbi:MAG: hypothetical protein OER04_11020 [Cyclobacteriaceae bacterium]|nr:hypothetical protein [Cyclobacteriaceae bacterium]